MHKAFPLPVMEFSLSEEVLTTSEESSHCQKKRDVTAEKIALQLKLSSNCQSKSYDSYVNEESSYCQTKRDVTAEKIALQLKLSSNCQSKSYDSYANRNEEVNIASGSTTGTNVSTASANIRVASINQDTACAYIASQSSDSQFKFKDIRKKISIQGTYMAGFDKLEVECFNCLARECRAPRSQDKGRRDNYRQGSKVEKQAPKALMIIDGVGWDWTYKKNSDSLNSKITELTDKLCEAKNMIYHYKLRLAQVEARLAEHRNQELKYCKKIRVIEFKTESRANCIESLTKDLELLKKEKGKLETNLTGFQTASKDLDNLLESQRLDKNKEGLGYSDIPPPSAQVYSPPKKDLSWTRLPEFADDTVTDYSRPAPTVESSPDDAQNRNSSVTVTEASPNTITPKPFIKFLKATDRLIEIKTAKHKTTKPAVKYAAMYSKPSKRSNVRGNQRNWNNLKSYQLGTNFVMKKKTCFNCGNFDHLAYDCGMGVKKGRTCPSNSHKTTLPRTVIHKPYRPPIRPMKPNMNAAQPNKTSFYKPAHSYRKRPSQRTSAVRSQFKGPRVPFVSRIFSTVNRKFPTANRKFSTGGTKFSTADMGNKGK
nr:ubiquitin hydrolase [Tanacetum cinerariifolium]